MFNKLSTRSKLLLFPILFVVIIISSAFVFSNYYSFSEKLNQSAIKTEIFIQDILKVRILAYQFLRQVNQNNADKVVKSLDSFVKVVEAFKNKLTKKENRDLSDKIINTTNEYSKYFKLLAKSKLEKTTNKEYENKVVSNLAQAGIKLEKLLIKINKSAKELKEDSIMEMKITLGLMALFFTLLFIVFSLLLVKQITSSINDFKEGLENFFKYINKELDSTKLLNDKSSDEFGEMAKVVNKNISLTQKSIEEDKKVIDEIIKTLAELEQGDLYQRVEISSSNPALEKLISLLNNMSINLETNISKVLNILEQYSNYKYINKIETSNLKEHVLRLANGVNNLGDSITNMLLENQKNGTTLDKSSNILIENINVLNTNSNKAAAALEETAAALEEITGNLTANTQSVIRMSQYAKELNQASYSGKELANQTSLAMEELSSKVRAISEAINSIDQIAFQTNILSLNAAVEAATAGEAGKGFAVVAQEVRNLASRSSEVAHEIKNLVEEANNKAKIGKDITSKMIEGYENLNENISHTTKMISDVEMASKEQKLGIEQISDAINSLDKQTQENAIIASQTQEVSMQTDSIAKTIVEDVNKKEFR